MDIFVPLVSLEFFQSSYIREVELQLARERFESDGIRVVPVLLWPIALRTEDEFLGQFNPLPAWEKACSRYVTHDGEYQSVHQPVRVGLREAINQVLADRRSKGAA